MGAMASQITRLTIVYSTVYSGADQRKHQNSASLAFVWGIHRWPVNSPHKWPVTRKMFSFDDVIMNKILRLMPHLSMLMPNHSPVRLGIYGWLSQITKSRQYWNKMTRCNSKSSYRFMKTNMQLCAWYVWWPWNFKFWASRFVPIKEFYVKYRNRKINF